MAQTDVNKLMKSKSGTSVEFDFNCSQITSDPLKLIMPRVNSEKRHVIKPRRTFKEYKNLFRAKKQTPSRDALCDTQKCLKEIVRIVSLADNRCTVIDDVPEEQIVEFDYNNPQKLDVQGIDQMHTYRKDEQDLQAKREYEIMKRELDRRRFTVVEKERFEQQVRDERFKLPDLYNIDIDPIYGGNDKKSAEVVLNNNSDDDEPVKEQEEEVVSEFHRDVELYRTKDKPKIQAIIEAEAERRVAALQNRLKKTCEKEKQAEDERKAMEKKLKEELSFTLAQNDFEKLFEEKKPEEIFVKPPDPKPPRQYPNTFKELKSLRRKLNCNRREVRDKCLVREKVFEKLGKHKFCKEKLLNADDFSDDVDSMSAQSSDGEDGLEIGYKNSQEFLIRGVHDKFSHEPRGKFLNRGKNRTVKTCLNRDEWIESTFLECERKKSLRKMHFVTNDITNEAYDIFHKKWKYQKPKNVYSPVKAYIEKGSKKMLETFTTTKTPNFKTPSSVKVRSFNLTDFLYGSRKGIKTFVRDDEKLHLEHELSEKNDLLEKLRRLEQDEKERLDKINRQRMNYLGFTCHSTKKARNTAKVINSDTDSDWLPNDENLESITDFQCDLKSERIPLKISNMRAPDFREPTLKRHPRRLRQKSLVTVQENDSRAPLDVSRLQKMDFDNIRQSNLTEEKKDINKHIKYRHHHDHLDHTQQKMVRVKYVPKVEKFCETYNATINTKIDDTNENDENRLKLPLKAGGFQQDWSRYFPESQIKVNVDDEEGNIRSEHINDETEINLQDLQEGEKSRFNQFIKSKYKEHITEASGASQTLVYEYPEAEKYRQQILDEQISAASCLSSASSSVCTNFTNDSGSFFIIMDKKVPLDYLMKNQVPFERLNENHRQAKLIEKEDEYHAPYLTVAHPGQKIEMREMCVPKDKFYTQVTRDRAGIKDRLKVEQVKLEQQLIGFGDEKFKARFG